MTLQEMKSIQDLIDLAQERGIGVKYQIVELDTGDIIDEAYIFGGIKISYNELILETMKYYDMDREEANDLFGLRVLFR